MRQLQRSIFFVLLVALLGGPLYGKPLRDPSTGLANGNLHDLSADNTTNPVHAVSDTRVCVFCHTPHSASAESVLWNRGFPQTFGSFPLYGGNIGGVAIRDDATSQASSQYGVDYPNGASRMCLSCHDGATAVGSVLVGGPIATNVTTLGDLPLPTLDPLVDQKIVDLAVSHPISFKYDATVRGNINNWHTVVKGDGKTYGLTDPAMTPLDSQSRMQCTTCHDPHNDNRATVGYPFWRHATGIIVDPYTDVCNNCHNAGPIGTPHSM